MNDPFIGLGIGELLGDSSEPPSRKEILRRMREAMSRRIPGLEELEAACESADPGCIERTRKMFEDSIDAGEPRVHPATDDGLQRARVDQLIYGTAFVSAKKVTP